MKDASAPSSAHRWLRRPVFFVEGPAQKLVTTAKVQYQAKIALCSAHVVIESGLSAPNEPSKTLTKIEFDAKVPLRPAFRYRLSATTTEFVTVDLEKNSHDTWTEIESGFFKRTRTDKTEQTMDLRSYRLPPVLMAPLVLQALSDAWDPSVSYYLAVVLAGSRPSLVVIHNQSGLLAEMAQLDIMVHSLNEFDLYKLADWQSDSFKSLDLAKGHRLGAVYSPALRAITRIELRLPVFGALALSLQP